ncbi:glycerol-3-phosphate dehydrogenase [Nematocida homosporus]|uniref:glycerol-3-phosphate dehydrogenase n=1 Tax=Nematocida homosporus TaxID=1912981 RepID=UPI00221EB602|nr:glycerol-3-phosphate dehydrogenase [Nematocida homosporus]KAI5187527.1 glycerol-3-phosphate dehydrogenase [Nematocida homosporus]
MANTLLRTLGFTGIAAATVAHCVFLRQESVRRRRLFASGPPLSWRPPTRDVTLARAAAHKYDILVIGGGSAGAGCLLDAATRGYSALLLERTDFAAGTSSKSTKLIHGGIRYLEKAFRDLDVRQLSLVLEGLRERKTFLGLAPYLTREVPILLPVTSRLMLPYFWLGTKAYDWLSGIYGISRSYWVPADKAAYMLPALNVKNLAGAMVYFDGQMNDARVNAMLVTTAAYYGADALNYAEVVSLTKEKGRTTGAVFKDIETGKTVKVRARVVINATGPWCDSIREMDSSRALPIMAPSSGTHLVLDAAYAGSAGLLNPRTPNGSVLFLLPWLGRALVGTTDRPVSTPEAPPVAADVAYLVKEMGAYLDPRVKPRAANILSIWTGVRPLARDPAAGQSKDIVRSHLVHAADSGLVTLAGGKWTSFREMAEEAVDLAAIVAGLPPKPCVTRDVRLIGTHRLGTPGNRDPIQTSVGPVDATMIGLFSARIARAFGLPADISKHLVRAYGDRAWKVCLIAGGNLKRIESGHPYLLAEVEYAINHEYARTIADFLGRRSMFAYSDVRAAAKAVNTVAHEFKRVLGWSKARMAEEKAAAMKYLNTMGLELLRQMEAAECEMTKFEQGLKRIAKGHKICSTQKAANLAKQLFGESERDAVLAIARGRTEIATTELLKTIRLQRDVLE